MSLYKVMFTTLNDAIIWDIEKEEAVSSESNIASVLDEAININQWKMRFHYLYQAWLNHNDQSIYDINHSINSEMINALKELNMTQSEFKIFYWFDVNRVILPEFQWATCPLSGKPLNQLPAKFHKLNKLISPELPLVFPIN